VIVSIWSVTRWASEQARVPERSRAEEKAVQVLALRPDDAARALGVSRSFFFAEILPELRVVRRGRLRLVPLRSLDEWIDRNAARGLD
jgi:hypothetical protein